MAHADVVRVGDAGRIENDIERETAALRHHEAALERIQNGQWKEGDAIPGEEALAREFGVSRMTVNRALRGYLEERRFGSAPYPTSLDLLRHLRAQASPQQQALITDLFERISFYDNRVRAATARKRKDGKYEVTLSLHAGKHYADGKGKERVGELDDWIDVGLGTIKVTAERDPANLPHAEL